MNNHYSHAYSLFSRIIIILVHIQYYQLVTSKVSVVKEKGIEFGIVFVQLCFSQHEPFRSTSSVFNQK